MYSNIGSVNIRVYAQELFKGMGFAVWNFLVHGVQTYCAVWQPSLISKIEIPLYLVTTVGDVVFCIIPQVGSLPSSTLATKLLHMCHKISSKKKSQNSLFVWQTMDSAKITTAHFNNICWCMKYQYIKTLVCQSFKPLMKSPIWFNSAQHLYFSRMTLRRVVVTLWKQQTVPNTTRISKCKSVGNPEPFYDCSKIKRSNLKSTIKGMYFYTLFVRFGHGKWSKSFCMSQLQSYNVHHITGDLHRTKQ